MAIEEGWERSLAYFCHVTTMFGNGLIYNYSSRSLEGRGISKSTLNNHVNFLLNKGLFKIVNGHLKSVSNNDLRKIVSSYNGRETGDGLITVKVHKEVKYTEWNLLARVPINCLKRQLHVSRKREEVNVIGMKVKRGGRLTKEESRFYSKNRDLFKKTENSVYTKSVCYLSDDTLGKLLKNRSKSNVRTMIKFWQDQGLVSCSFHKGKTLDTHVTKRQYRDVRESSNTWDSTYLYKGRVIQNDKRSITFGNNIIYYVDNGIMKMKKSKFTGNPNSTC